MQYTKDPPTYFAERLYKSMKGAGTDDSSLIRVIVTRSEVRIYRLRTETEKAFALKSYYVQHNLIYVILHKRQKKKSYTAVTGSLSQKAFSAHLLSDLFWKLAHDCLSVHESSQSYIFSSFLAFV